MHLHYLVNFVLLRENLHSSLYKGNECFTLLVFVNVSSQYPSYIVRSKLMIVISVLGLSSLSKNICPYKMWKMECVYYDILILCHMLYMDHKKQPEMELY